LPLSCEVIEKKVVLGPQFLGEGIPKISHMHFQIALTSEHPAGFE